MRQNLEHKVGHLLLSNALGIAVTFAFGICHQSSQAAEIAWQSSINKGNTNIAAGDLIKAERCFRRAVEQLKQTPHTAEQFAECQNKLANALALEGKTDEAESLYQRSLSDLERAYGKNSQKIAPTLLALGSFLEAEGDHSSAMALYKNAMNINEKSYSQISPAVADIVHHPVVQLGAMGVTPYQPTSTTLSQQAGLGASQRLLKALPPIKDHYNKDDNSDQDLLSDFRSEVMDSESASAKRLRRTASLQALSRSNAE